MKVILKKDVRDLGKTGDMVNVSPGYGRNFLFPRDLAAEATESKIKEFEHWTRVAASRKKKAREEKTVVLEQVKKVSISFKLAAGEKDKLFGSVTNKDISVELAKKGFEVDKKDVQILEPIKVLGQHKAKISFGDGLETEIVISVERDETVEAPKA
jgi:large subunit ribosomal protein L9